MVRANGKAPVGQHHFSESTEQHLRGFQVAMHDALRVGERDGLRDIDEDVHMPREIILPRRVFHFRL
jgi:hypothetical protein